jgi:hypothetical protein
VLFLGEKSCFSGFGTMHQEKSGNPADDVMTSANSNNVFFPKQRKEGFHIDRDY